MISSSSMPPNIRKCLQPETRSAIGKAAMTTAEADAKFNARAEKKLQENIAALLRQRNICFFSQRMDRRTSGTVGWPDFTFGIKGKDGVAIACAVECKVLDGKLTQEQWQVLIDLDANGWAATVVRSEAEFLAFIKSVESEAAQ
jgi:hypothetical protein